MADSLALELLKSGGWGEDEAMVSRFLASPWFSRLAAALGSLKRESLYMSHVHGVGHVERTMVHGAMCAWAEELGGADTGLLLTMCAYHDTGRVCDYLDGTHGKRSADKLAALTGLSGEDLREARGGLEAHSVADRLMEDILRSYGPEDLPRARMLAQMLKDSDGLDRVRICDLDVRYLRRPASGERGRFAQQLFDRYAALEHARGLDREGEGFTLSDVRLVKALVTERFAAGDGCGETALRVWDEMTGERLAESLLPLAEGSPLCGILTAAEAYFAALFARQGRVKGEIEAMRTVFRRRFREQYGSEECARLKSGKRCGGFAVDSILFSYQYMYQENINGVGSL